MSREHVGKFGRQQDCNGSRSLPDLVDIQWNITLLLALTKLGGVVSTPSWQMGVAGRYTVQCLRLLASFLKLYQGALSLFGSDFT